MNAFAFAGGRFDGRGAMRHARTYSARGDNNIAPRVCARRCGLRDMVLQNCCAARALATRAINHAAIVFIYYGLIANSVDIIAAEGERRRSLNNDTSITLAASSPVSIGNGRLYAIMLNCGEEAMVHPLFL